jgi:hypothetical protein
VTVQARRRIGIVVCAVLAAASLVYGVIELTEGWLRLGGSYLAYAGLFGVSAVLFRRRPGWRRAGVAFGLLILYVVVLYIVLVAVHNHGRWPFSL